jgi:hypothetical protein
MKKMMTVVAAICLTMAVTAQRGHGVVRSRVVVVSPSFGFGYSPFYSPFGYSPLGYPYGYNNGYNRPSRLEMKVADIKTDYKDKIKSARHDSGISKDERKKIVSQLKSDRDKAIHDLKTNYYKQKTTATGPGSNG